MVVRVRNHCTRSALHYLYFVSRGASSISFLRLIYILLVKQIYIRVYEWRTECKWKKKRTKKSLFRLSFDRYVHHSSSINRLSFSLPKERMERKKLSPWFNLPRTITFFTPLSARSVSLAHKNVLAKNKPPLAASGAYFKLTCGEAWTWNENSLSSRAKLLMQFSCRKVCAV